MSSSLIDFRVRPPRSSLGSGDAVAIDANIAPYGRLYDIENNERLTDDDLFAEAARHGVKMVMQAEYESGMSRSVNVRVATFAAQYPDVILGGVASVDPREPDALEELTWAHDELGLRGWVFQPGFLHVNPMDPRCFPIYAYCERQGHPVTIHTGINFSRSGPIEYGRPTWIDQVACAFPHLVLVCNHGGWPWVMETIAVLWKHENVYADFGAVAPKYLAHPSSGWSPIVHWMNTQLRHKVLLATDWPNLRYERLVEELPLLELCEESYDAYVRGNAQALIDRVWG